VELARQMAVPVLFVATAEAGDEEMRQRIEQHRKDRPSDWRTLEVTEHISSQIEEKIGDAKVVLIDCIALLVGNIFSKYRDRELEQIKESLLEKELDAEIGELVRCMEKVDVTFIIVSNEVGWGVVPATRVGRLYRDLLGKANQVLARCVDEVYLVVAGLPLKMTPRTQY